MKFSNLNEHTRIELIKNNYLLMIEAIISNMITDNDMKEHSSSFSEAKEYLRNIQMHNKCLCKACIIDKNFLYPVPKPLEFLLDLIKKDLESTAF
jgi:hypothetical protein